MKRLLFVAESVTLAHFFRPFCVARRLDPARFEVHFAARESHRAAVEGAGFRFHPITGISSASFLESLRTGSPPFDLSTLRAFAREDAELVARVRPAAMVSDFRLSLPVASERERIPLYTITNVHWAPWARLPRWPLPDLSGFPLGEVLPVPLARAIFLAARPIVFSKFLAPLNRLRREHGQEAFPSLGAAYTHGDFQLLDDVPGLIGTRTPVPPSAYFCGPLIEDALAGLPTRWPEGWDLSQPPRKGRTYVSMGSSGSLAALEAVIRAIESLGWEALMATATRFDSGELPGFIRSAPILPGALCAQVSDVVITNGGSAPCYQALSQGKPILALPSNMDQFLFSEALEKAGLAVVLRADRAQAEEIARGICQARDCLSAAREFGTRIRELQARNIAAEALSAP
ncbi:MAG: hypothetical protein NDJ89_04200 [Oligoflexia bacterium]|nr:hypothetical protein [Oligoflexia bacterium]